MKRIYLFTFFCCLLLTIMGETTVNEREEIDLCDKHIKKKQKSLIKPVQAFIGRSVEVDFNTALGIIDISVYDETGNTVYWQSVNAYAGLQVFIDIASGDFEIR